METPTPTVRRLAPTPGTVDSIEAAYDLPRPRPDSRPWISVTMIASLDGSTSLDGGSGGLGNPNDIEVLSSMRRLADVILVGAGTARSEGYGPAKKPDQRIAVATNSGRVDLDSDLFTSGSGFVLAPTSADIDERRVDVLRAGDDKLDLAAAIDRLDEIVPGVAHVNAEGGPRLNGTLADADLVDELTLTISPQVTGGPGARIVAGAGELHRHFRLDQLLGDDDGYLFGRWLRRR